MKLKKIAAIVITTIASVSSFAGNVDGSESTEQNSGVVNTKPTYSQQLLNSWAVTGTEIGILNTRQSGELSNNKLYIGGRVEFYGIYGDVTGNHNSNYFPGTLTAGFNNKDYSATNIKMPYIDLAFTSTIGDWITGIADLQVNNTSTSNVTLPNAYIIVGNLSKSPFYFVGGKKVVSFGNFNSVANFTPTLTRAYFMAYGGQIAVGYTNDDLDVTATVMNGLGESMLNSKASSANQISDFAISATYTHKNDQLDYYVGTGYINATGFSDENNNMIGAFDLNGGVKFNNLQIDGEFLLTSDNVHNMNDTSVYAYSKANAVANGGENIVVVPTDDGESIATSNYVDTSGYTAFSFNSIPALINFNSGDKVMAWSVSSTYTISVSEKDLIPYLSYSQAAQNYDNNLYQIEIGTRFNVTEGVWIGASYNYLTGTSDGDNIGKFNTLMFNAAAYF